MKDFIDLCEWLGKATAGRQLLIPLQAAIPGTPEVFLLKGKLGPELKVFFVAVNRTTLVKGLIRISDAEPETSKMELDVFSLDQLIAKKLTLENYLRKYGNPPTFSEQLLTLTFEGGHKVDLRPSMFDSKAADFDAAVLLLLKR